MDSANAGVAHIDAQPIETTVKVKDGDEVVSTHVLVAEDQVEQLRALSRRTRVAQSEYLREAVDDLLRKYHKREGGK